MTPVSLSLLALVAVRTASASATPPIIVVIPQGSAAATDAAAHLGDELGGEPEVKTAASLDPEALALRARTAWPESMVIVLDPAKNEAWLMRPNDQAILARRLPARSEASPFAIAVAAAELVRIAAADRQVRAAAPAAAAVAAHEPERASLELALSIGMGVSGSFEGERARAEPVFGADLNLGADRWWSSIGLRVRGPSGATSAEAEGVTLEYRRTDVSARIAFGPELDRLLLFGVLEAGTGFVHARASRGSETLGEDSRAPFWVAAGVEAHYTLWRALRASLSVQVARALSPADYVGAARIVFAEGDVRVHAAAGLDWVIR